MPSDAIIIDTPSPHDLDEVHDAFTKSWLTSYETILGSRRAGRCIPSIEIFQSWLKEVAATGVDHFRIARIGGEIVGHALSGQAGYANRAHLASLYVRPDAQGRGVGSRLLQDALVRNAAYPSMRLEVLLGNTKARAFYAGHGFTPFTLTFDRESFAPVLVMRRPRGQHDVSSAAVDALGCAV